MSKTSIKPAPDGPSPKPGAITASKPPEAAGPVAPELTEGDYAWFRWSMLVWLLGFGFIWAILILELFNDLFFMIRRAFGGS
jgi:hypothetical protein